MYNVSNAYKAAIVSSDRETYIAGTITLADNTVIPITNSKIKQGSLYYTNQCVSDDGFMIGYTHRGKQGLTIYDDVTNYRAFKGAKIELIYYLKISPTEYEGVPLGIFTVVDAERTTAHTIKLVGYDNMTKFDVDYPLSIDDRYSRRTPFERLKDICTALGVELWDADANVQAQLSLMPNGTQRHALVWSPEIITARDYLDYLCQLLCGFATIDRLGRLRIVCWKLKGTITGYAIPDNLRKSSTFNDTILKYSAVNMTVSFYEGADGGFVKNVTAPEIPTGAGEVLSMYTNALIRAELYNNRQAILNNIASVLTNTDDENGTVMQWIPCDIQYTGDPALDLGDWVTYTGYTAGDGIEVPIHKIDWKYRGWQRLETVDMNRQAEARNNADRARQEELATIIKSGVGAKGTGENAEIFNDYTNNIASGKYSHSSGKNSTASGELSFASGSYATASGFQSVALGGNNTQASGYDSVAMGGGKAIGSGSFAVGYGCEARKDYSVALGGGNIANRSSAFTAGYYNIAGNETGFGGTESVAIGYQNKTTGDRAVAMGYMCEAGSHAVAIGESNKSTGRGSSTIGGASNTASGDNSATLGGMSNKATNSYSVAVGGGNNEANGAQSAVLGGSTNKTSGYYSATIGGYNNTASGNQAVAMGSQVISKGDNQLALGKYNVEDTTNQYALVIGGGTSSVRKNIFTVDWAGNVKCTGTVNGGSGGGGADGKSAYEIAVENGFIGTEVEWLESLKGADGADGADGKSAYQIWLDAGNIGAESEFLASLKGADGVNGTNGENGADGYTPIKGIDYFTDADIESLNIANKVDKIAGKGLSTNDLTNILKSNYDTAYVNSHTHSNKSILDGITSTDISNWNSGGVTVVNNLTSTSTTSALSANQGRVLDTNKVDKISGKGLSTNDLTAALKSNYDTAYTNSHTHSNKSVLDATTASYTTSLNTKLSGIAAGAQVNQNAFYRVLSGSTYITASSESDTFSIQPGNYITITPDATNKRLIINSQDTTYSTATTSSNGLMEASDKVITSRIKAGTGSNALTMGATTNLAGSTGALAIGSATNANGIYAFAAGAGTEAWQYQTVLGKYNVASAGQTLTSTTSGSPLIIGKGTSSTKANCFRVETSGVIYSTGAYNTTGADYAEYFEWADGNPNNEDRRGLFVTLDGEKIRTANSQDDYILGVISANASVIGDSHEDQWQGMYLYDMYGSPVLEWVEEPAVLDDDGNVIQDAYMVQTQKLNLDYDPAKPYVPRSQRKEWAVVGMMGKIIVRDDGTCQANGYCCVADGGIATASDMGYRVLSRFDDNHIKILIK